MSRIASMNSPPVSVKNQFVILQQLNVTVTDHYDANTNFTIYNNQ